MGNDQENSLSSGFLLSEESSFAQATPFPVSGECLIREQAHRITSGPRFSLVATGSQYGQELEHIENLGDYTLKS